MSSFADGFITGLANKLSSGIDERRDSARKYFERQLEIAQTTGLDNLKKSKTKSRESLGFANQLLQLGVPRSVIMAQAKSNPEGLGQLVGQVTELQSAYGGKLKEEDFADLWNVSGAVENPDEDFATFFGRIYEPLKGAVTEDPEGFRANPGRSLWRKMFAMDGYQNAQGALEDTEVVGGYSAADLIRLGDNAVEGDPSVTVTPNFEKLGEMERAAKQAKADGEALNTTEANYVTQYVQEGLIENIQSQITAMAKEGATFSTPEEIKAVIEEILSTSDLNEGVYKHLEPKVQRAILDELSMRVQINSGRMDTKIPGYGDEAAPTEATTTPETATAAEEEPAPVVERPPAPTVGEEDYPEAPRVRGVSQIQPGVYTFTDENTGKKYIVQWVGKSEDGKNLYKDRETGNTFKEN